jgi:hypothetical protein
MSLQIFMPNSHPLAGHPEQLTPYVLECSVQLTAHAVVDFVQPTPYAAEHSAAATHELDVVELADELVWTRLMTDKR